MANREPMCPKCGVYSGDSWTQCNGACPLPGSPHYKPDAPLIEQDPEGRWLNGMEHHPKSVALFRHIDKVDFAHGDFFGWKSGGDGDNGERLMFLMDSYFETQDREDRRTWLVIYTFSRHHGPSGTANFTFTFPGPLTSKRVDEIRDYIRKDDPTIDAVTFFNFIPLEKMEA